jgi:hypothetical protein
MKTLVPLVAALCLLSAACSTPPPVSGMLSSKHGSLTLDSQGRVIITVEPRSGK